ncbi:hypothetical protein VPHK356_0106 [Vibrio phage K356]|nr:hypothetical protein MYOV002v2_p0098 [Vibrio phage 144E46.1]
MKVTFTPVVPLSEYLSPTDPVQFVNDMKGTTWHECHKGGQVSSYVMRLRSNGDYVIMETDGSFNVKNLDGLLRYLSAWKLQVRRNVTRLYGVLYQEPDTVEAGSLSINTTFSYDKDGDERQCVVIRDSSKDNSPNVPVINLADMSQQFVLKTLLVQVVKPTGLAITCDRK